MPPRKRPRSESAEAPQPTRSSRRLRSQEPEVKPVASPAPAAKQRRTKKVTTRAKAATKKQQPKKPQLQRPLPRIQEESVASQKAIEQNPAVQSDSADEVDIPAVSSSASASQTPAPDANPEPTEDRSPPAQQIIHDIVSLSSSDEAPVTAPEKVSLNVTVETGRVTRSRSRSQQSQQSQESESQDKSSFSHDSQQFESLDEAQISRESQEAEAKRQAQLSRQSQQSESPKQAQLSQASPESESPKQTQPPLEPKPSETVKAPSESEVSESADDIFTKKSKYRIPVAANKRATRSRTASEKKALEPVQEVEPLEAAPASASDGNNSADEVRPSVEDEEIRKQKKIAERKIIVDRFKKGMAAQYAKQDAEKAAAEKAKAAKEQAEEDDVKAMPPPPPKKRGRPPKSVATARKSLAMTTETNEEGPSQAAILENNPDDSDDEDGPVRERAVSNAQDQAFMMSGALNASPRTQKTPQKKTPRQPRRRHISPPGPPSSSPLSVLSHTPTLLGDYASPYQLSPLASRTSILSNPPTTPQQTSAQGPDVQPQTTGIGWRRFLTPISRIATIFRRAPQTAPIQSFADRSALDPPQESMTGVERSPLNTIMLNRMSGRNHVQNVDSPVFDDEQNADATMGDYKDENEVEMSDDEDEFLWSLPRTPGRLNQRPLGTINQGEAPLTAPIKRFVGTPESKLWTGRRAIPASERIRRAKERETRLAREERISREEAALKRRIEHQRRNHFRRLYGPRPGEKRKYHVMVDKMESIPNPPGGGYGMYDKFFEQGDDSDDDIVSIHSEDGVANIGYDAFSPISRKRVKFAREGVEAFMESDNNNAMSKPLAKEVVGDLEGVTGGSDIITATPTDNAGGTIESTAAPTDVVEGSSETVPAPENIFSKVTEDTFARTVVPHGNVEDNTPDFDDDDDDDAYFRKSSKTAEQASVTPKAAASSKKEKEWKPKSFEEEMYGKPTFTFEYSDTESDGEGDSDFPVIEEEDIFARDADYPDNIPIPLRAKMLKVLDMEVVRFLHIHGHTLTNDEWAMLEDYPSDDESIHSSANDQDDETWAKMKNPYEFLKYVYDTIVHTKLDPFLEARYLGKLRNLRKKIEIRPFPVTEPEIPDDPEATQDSNIFAQSSNTAPPAGLTPSKEVETSQTPSSVVETPVKKSSRAEVPDDPEATHENNIFAQSSNIAAPPGLTPSKEVETPQTPSSAVETPAESSSSADERAENQKALTRARERAEVHKPKTPSRLREVSRVASSPLAPVTPENPATDTAIQQVPATAPPAIQAPAIGRDYTGFDFGQARSLVEGADPEMLAKLEEDAKKPGFAEAAWKTYGPMWQPIMDGANQLAAERMAAA